jgi:hypothetical protein
MIGAEVKSTPRTRNRHNLFHSLNVLFGIIHPTNIGKGTVYRVAQIAGVGRETSKTGNNNDNLLGSGSSMLQ